MSVVWPRLRWPRRTARLRLTAVYGGLFLLSGAVLAVITYVLFERATRYRTPPIPKIPRTPVIGSLKLPSLLPAGYSALQNQLAQAQNQLAQAQHQLVGLPEGPIRRKVKTGRALPNSGSKSSPKTQRIPLLLW